jgi:signal peptidase II
MTVERQDTGHDSIPTQARAQRIDPRTATILAIAAMAGLDQITKIVAVESFTNSAPSWGRLELSVIRNSGGPLGLASGSTLIWTLLTTALVGVAIVTILRRRLDVGSPILLGILIGGGLGNVIDRYVRAPGIGRGAVVDWIQIESYTKVFNLADVGIRVASLLLIMSVLRHKRSNPKERSSAHLH